MKFNVTEQHQKRQILQSVQFEFATNIFLKNFRIEKN